jgi:hydrogenase expression/formation protein HypE
VSDAIIQLAHGGGGRLSRRLIEEEILPRFGAQALSELPDAAELAVSGQRLLFTTDSFVVQPPEFPGGNIGNLAVHGTVNDLAVCGGRPRWLSLGLILEEGLELALLRRVLDAAAAAAADCGVQVVTGDTKVVARGQADGLYVNSAGIGEALPGFSLGPGRVRPDDRVLISGPLGDHGLAVLAVREGINIAGGPVSDSGPVHRLVLALAELAPLVRFMRDPTRGGAAAVLNELAAGREIGVELSEADIPVSPGTRALAEMLGLDVLQVASEGRLFLVCAPEAAAPILARWQALPEGRGAACVGSISRRDVGRVILKTVSGGRRLVDVPQGELLPRIC